MKYKAIVLIVLSTIFVTSCKNSQSEQITNTPETFTKERETLEDSKKQLSLLEKKALKIMFVFETTEPDIFQIKFNAFDKENTLLKNATVKKTNQTVTFTETFDVEKNDIPKSVYLILGVKNLKKIKLDKIQLTTNEISINVTKENLLDYFVLNQYLNFDSQTGVLETFNYEGKHVPILSLSKRAYEVLLLY